MEAWFLGPRAENAAVLERLIVEALRDHVFWRRNFHPRDPRPITETVRRERGYLAAVDRLNDRYQTLLADLKRSAPFFSMRYQGHMIWDQTLPAMAGYFAAMLYNPNNVAREASPATTAFEREVGEQLCRMVGYPADGRAARSAETRPLQQQTSPAWGHLTLGGTTANIEALWMARNLKLLPLTLRQALGAGGGLEAARGLTVAGGRLVDLDAWALLNLPADEVIALPARMEREHGVAGAVVQRELARWSPQELGLVEFFRTVAPEVAGAPVVLAAGSRHYSLPKAAALLGLGAQQLRRVPVDLDGRIDLAALDEELARCRRDQVPVAAVVAILGSTEEGAIDDLVGVLAARERWRAQGLEFLVHADGAWGGYFASLLRPPAGATLPDTLAPLSRFAADQLAALPRADTITVDPHKTGYVPYPAGALCYRNGALRTLVAFDAPYINPDEGAGDGFPLGKFGVEGSRPGAAAAAVYLSHAVVPPDRSGYGKILARAVYSAKLLYARLVCLAQPEDRFLVVPVPRLRLDAPLFAGCQDAGAAAERLRRTVLARSHHELLAAENRPLLEQLCELGPDLNVVTYAFNVRIEGRLNDRLSRANALNRRIHEHASVRSDGRDIYGYRLLLSNTELRASEHGEAFFQDFLRRLLGPAPIADGDAVMVLRSVVMDPWIVEDLEGRPFLDTILAELRATVTAAIDEVIG